MIKFNSNLRYLRELHGYKQTDMEDIIGIKRSTWNNYERGDSEPGLVVLVALSDLFQVNTDRLLREDLTNDIQVLSNIDTVKNAAKNTGNGTGNGTGNTPETKNYSEYMKGIDADTGQIVIAALRQVVDTKEALITSLNAQLYMVNKELEECKKRTA